jgi:hypothetical protein
MKTLTYAAVVLAVIAGTAPAMAQYIQSAAPDAPIAVPAQPSAGNWRGQPGGMYEAYGQPNQVYGMPGAGQASASSHLLRSKLTERGMVAAPIRGRM